MQRVTREGWNASFWLENLQKINFYAHKHSRDSAFRAPHGCRANATVSMWRQQAEKSWVSVTHFSNDRNAVWGLFPWYVQTWMATGESGGEGNTEKHLPPRNACCRQGVQHVPHENKRGWLSFLGSGLAAGARYCGAGLLLPPPSSEPEIRRRLLLEG